jgi:membrane associated rhomboid family serine protease
MTAKAEKRIPLGSFPPTEFLIVSMLSGLRLGWNLVVNQPQEIVFIAPPSLRSEGEEITIGFAPGQAIILSRCNTAQTNDSGKNQDNINRLLNTFSEIRKVHPAVSTLPTREVEQLIEEAIAQGQTVKAESAPQGISIMAALIPKGEIKVTPILIWANVIIWLIMVITGVHFLSPEPTDLYNWGANLGPNTQDGQPWRLLTSVFLHSGVVHILLNMLALAGLGILLEKILGSGRFLLVYLATGIAASVTSMAINAPIVSVGASGAIFGVAGALIAILYLGRSKLNLNDPTLLRSIIMSLLPSFLAGFTTAHIDNAAHGGGALSGLLLGGLMCLFIFPPVSDSRRLFSFLMPVIFTGAVMGIFYSLPVKEPIMMDVNFEDGARHNQLAQNLGQREERVNAIITSKNIPIDSLHVVITQFDTCGMLLDSLRALPTFNAALSGRLFELKKQEYSIYIALAQLDLNSSEMTEDEIKKKADSLGIKMMEVKRDLAEEMKRKEQ